MASSFNFPEVGLSRKQASDKEKLKFSFHFLPEKTKFKDIRFLNKFMNRLKLLSSKTWEEVAVSGRHEYGWEIIPKEQFKFSPPLEEVKYLVFRACSDNNVFVGFRTGATFNVVFIEETINTAYDHG